MRPLRCHDCYRLILHLSRVTDMKIWPTRSIQILLAVVSLIFAASPSKAVAPAGPQGNTPQCLLACVVKATIALNPPTGGIFGLLENHSFLVGYTVSNNFVANIRGIVTVTYNGQVLQDLGNQGAIITLSPMQQYIGTVLVNSPPDGIGSIVAKFYSPLSCTGYAGSGSSGQTGIGDCIGYELYATMSTDVTVAPDKDGDGLSDTIENSLLATYAPLMLYSQDHGQQEQYAPIDVLDFVRASSLISVDAGVPGLPNSALQDPNAILDPAKDGTNLGRITSKQSQLDTNGQPVSTLPRAIYVSPCSNAQPGARRSSVVSSANIGLYGHVVLINAAEVGDPVLAAELSAMFCDTNRPVCDKAIYKVEYWQYYGYSHDFEVPNVPILGDVLKGLAADLVDHGGDWCTVQLYIDPDVVAPESAILAVYHYAHGLQFGFDFAQVTARGPTPKSTAENPTKYDIDQLQGPNMGQPVNLPVTGADSTVDLKNAQNNVVQLAMDSVTKRYVHPVVYVEWGGHEFWPTSGWSFAYTSKHSGDGYNYFAAPPPNVGEIGQPMPGVSAAILVTSFAGYWGYYGWENQNKPPQGPPLHSQWSWLPHDALLQSV